MERPARAKRLRAATAAAAVVAALLGAIACGSAYSAADEPADLHDASGGPLDAVSFPEGSVILLDGAVVLPDGTVGDAPSDQSSPECRGDADCERVVFVTSVPFDVTQVAVASNMCTKLAAGTTLARVNGREFEAWVSTSASPVSTRLVHGTKPYTDSFGNIIATTWTDLTDGTLAAPFFRDENGVAVSGGTLVWTATAASGALAMPNCAEFTSSAGTATVGVVGATSGTWSAFTTGSCGATARLYCFER